MHRLSVLRHAKSSWASPGLADHERPLNERGNEQATALCEWLGTQDIGIDRVLVSPATRTMETLSTIRPSLNGAPEEIIDALYNGSPDTYLNEAMAHDGKHVLIVGHNPACDELVRTLAAQHGEAAARLNLAHYGTANFTTLVFDGAYAAGSGTVETFLRPRDLLAKAD
ncbi:MAG: histidine phosphatase family protein [Pseudomonadota bacterium]